MSSRRTFLALAGLALLTGCGFQPVYGTATRGGDGSAGLSNIRINPIADRPGQILRNHLLDQMQPQGLADKPRYVLDVNLSETRHDLGIQRDATTTLARLVVNAGWRLSDAETGQKITDGRSQSVVSYTMARSGFTNIVTEGDTRERALKEIADDITTRLVAFTTKSR